MNLVILLGRLGRDPELRQAGDTTLCRFSLATSVRVKGETRTDWHQVTAFGRQAETCARYLTRGAPACVVGTLRTREYTTAAGETRRATEVVADRVEFVAARRERDDAAAGPAPAVEDGDDALPF